jgi:chromosome segregation ATPase
MDLSMPQLLAMAGGGGALLFLGGVFLGRGRGPARLMELKRALDAARGAAPATPPAAEKAVAVGGAEAGELDGLRRELEIVQSELHQKDHHIDELKENINRLGGRILDVENELHAKEEELREFTRRNPEKELIDSMDPFVDALQKESDQLREELENAYRMINRQELDLARLKGSTLELNPDSGALHEKISNLEFELDSLRQKCAKYELMMLQVRMDSQPDDETLPFPAPMPSGIPEVPVTTPAPAPRPGPLPEL